MIFIQGGFWFQGADDDLAGWCRSVVAANRLQRLSSSPARVSEGAWAGFKAGRRDEFLFSWQRQIGAAVSGVKVKVRLEDVMASGFECIVKVG